MHDQLLKAGCPAHVCDAVAAHPVAAAFPPGFWLSLIGKYGPQIVESILAALQAHPPVPNTPTPPVS